MQGAIWVRREWETLRTLAEVGAPVPRPLAAIEDAILMSHVGDPERSAPQLRAYRPAGDEAEDLFGQVIRAIELMLYRNVIHGDLSAYNLLVWRGRAMVIDLPQAIDPRKNRHARALLERDVARICDHFARYGVRSSPGRIAADLWTGWQLAELVPEELRAGIEL